MKAISFDLDDTLYDNYPVIYRTVIESHAALQKYHPALYNFTLEHYEMLRHELLQCEPNIYHDVSQWRYRAFELALIKVGLSIKEAAHGAHEVMKIFHSWRNLVHIPEETHNTLTTLGKYVPLVAISNGNADPYKLGINQYFKFTLRAGPDGRAKPCKDMYYLAAERLGIQPLHILHVGDDLMTDVVGSLNAGMQACWLNFRAVNNLIQDKKARLLPHVEISQLASLTSLTYLLQ